MPKKQDSLNNDLFNMLQSRGYDPIMKDSSGKEMPVPEEAEVFQFNFVKDDVDYGVVTVTIDGLRQLVVYYGKDVETSPKSGDQDSESWHSLLKRLSVFAHNHQLSFDTRYMDRLKYDMAKREHTKLNEGYYSMGKKASYSDNIPECKIIIQHNRNIEEGEQRYRNVAKIFIENAQGERFLAPTTKPGIARVYARHIAEGGTPYDERGQHITSLVEEYSKMAGFVRATRGGQFNESAQQLVAEGINHYQKLRESLHKIAGKKGYNTYFESWTPPLMESEEDVDLSEMFMSSSLDPRIESVMPILGKLSKNITESPKLKEVQALEEWADSIIEAQDPLSIPEEELDEDWKSALAGGALAASMALGGGAAHAQSVDTQAPTAATQQAPIGSTFTAGVDMVGPRMIAYKGGEFKFAGRDAEAPATAKTSVVVPMSAVGVRSFKPVTVQLDTGTGMYYISAQQPTNESEKDEADYGYEYQEMVKRVGKKAKEQEKAKQEKPTNEGLGYSQDPEQAKWYHEGRKAYKGGTTGNLIQDIARKHGCPAEWLKAFHAGYQDQEGWGKEDMAENLDPQQKSAGQLGPTEKVKNNNIGKLVGANEGKYSKDVERAFPDGKASGVKEHPKKVVIKTNKEIGTRVSDIGPGGKEHNVKTDKAWDKAQSVKEGQADLDTIKRLVGL